MCQSKYRPPESTRCLDRRSTACADQFPLLPALADSCLYFLAFVPLLLFRHTGCLGAHPCSPYYNTPICLELPDAIRLLRLKTHWPPVQWGSLGRLWRLISLHLIIG